jgi:hypothetical protein
LRAGETRHRRADDSFFFGAPGFDRCRFVGTPLFFFFFTDLRLLDINFFLFGYELFACLIQTFCLSVLRGRKNVGGRGVESNEYGRTLHAPTHCQN